MTAPMPPDAPRTPVFPATTPYAVEEEPLWYLSFAASGHGFRGGVITQAPSNLAAWEKTYTEGINPGGQVLVIGPMPTHWAAPEMRDRLLRAHEIVALPAPAGNDDWRDVVRAARVSEDCNNHGPTAGHPPLIEV